jgi:hypothetical protein
VRFPPHYHCLRVHANNRPGGIEDGISPANLTPAAPPRTSQMEDIVHQNPVVQTSQMEDLFHQNPVAQASQMASALQIPASNVATIQEALARSFGSTTMAPQVADVVDQTPASTHVQLALAPTSQVTDAVHQTLGLTAITPQQALVPQTSQVTGGSHQTPANAAEQTLQSVLARIVSLEDNKSPVQGSSVTVELGSTTSEPSASQLIVRNTESCTAPQLATPQALSRKRDSLTTSPSVPSSGNASTTKAACTTAAASMDQAHGDLVSQSSTSTPSTLTKPKSKPTAPTQTTLTTKSSTGSKFTQPILHSLENVLWAAKGPLINQLRPVDQMYLDALTAHFYDKFMARLFDASKTEGN